MNKVILIGRISKDPEAFTTQGGVSRSVFDVAVQRKYKNQDGKYDADFLRVVAWRQTADYCNKYLSKGRLVAVEGSIQNRSFTAQDGSKRYVTEIIAENVQGLDKASDAKPKQESEPENEPESEGFTEVEDDELPF